MNRAPWEAFGAANPDPLNNQVLELYNLDKDFSQSQNVADKNPDKVKEMKQMFIAEAKKYQVFPLDASVAARIVAPRPNITAGRTEFVYTQPMVGLPQGDSPMLLNCSYTITADIDVPARRSGGHDPDLGWPFWRLRILPAQRQAGVPLEPDRPQAAQVGEPRTRSRPANIQSSSTSSTTASASALSPSTT